MSRAVRELFQDTEQVQKKFRIIFIGERLEYPHILSGESNYLSEQTESDDEVFNEK